MATETAFVTGGSGFIGGRLIERLRSDGVAVRALVRSDASAGKVRALGAEPVPGDIADADSIRSAAESCTLAFHAAANVSDWGKRDELERDNVEGTRHSLEGCGAAGVRRFVHVGTEAALLAGQPLVNVDETAPLRPDSPVLYSSTKARAEQLVRDANRDGFETVVIRPRFVWGPGDTTVIAALADAVRAGRFSWIGGGRQRTSTTHVDNAVEGLVLGARKGQPGGVYFVTDGEPVVFRDFVTALLATQGVTPPNRSIPRPLAAAIAAGGETLWRALRLPGAPPVTRFAVWASALETTIDIRLAERELGYEPVKTREAGLRELSGVPAS